MDISILTEKYQLILEKRVQPDPNKPEAFQEFVEKRAAGAHKIADSAKTKGGFSTLTAIHFKAKEAPYKEVLATEKKFEGDCDSANAHYKKKAEEVYAKLKDLDKLSQKEFQALMGELEVWGEVYIRGIKPESLKI